MKDYEYENELIRRKLWLEVWLKCFDDKDREGISVSNKCADEALRDFDARFSQLAPEDPRPLEV